MPQFVMEGCLNPDFQTLPAIVRGYIEAMFWTETCASQYTIANWQDPETQEAVTEGQADGNVPSDAGFDDLHPDALADIITACEAFEKEAGDLIAAAVGKGDYSKCDARGYAHGEAVGHDFWLTRNGHGVGFWDRNLGDEGDALSKIARKFGEAYVWFGDHVENGDAPFVYHD